MSPTSDQPSTWLRRTLRPALRLGAGALLFGPGVSKPLTYDQSVQFFTTLGLPVPELLVVVVGGVEIGAALSLFLDRAPWIGALVAVPIMAVAIATAGPSWQNVSVFLAGAILVASDRHVLTSRQ